MAQRSDSRNHLTQYADMGDTASLEGAVIDPILELIHTIRLTSGQRMELLHRAAASFEQEDKLHN